MLRFRLLLPFLMILLAAAPWSCQREEASPEIFHIGLVTTLSGPSTREEFGTPTLNAARMALDEVNSGGGLVVGGKKIRVEIHIEDDEDNPEKAVSAAYKLINHSGVAALVAPHMSRNAIPLSRIAESARIPTISPTSTNPATTEGKRYVFRACFVDTFQGAALASFARRELGAKRAAVLFDEASAYNRGLAEVFKKAFLELGGTIASSESYVTGQEDFSLSMGRIGKNGADILFLPNYYGEAQIQANTARRLGISATILGSDAWGAVQTYPPALDGAFFTDTWHASLAQNEKYPQARIFVERYVKRFGVEPSSVAAFTYETLGLFFRAIQKQGAWDPESIREGLLSMGPYMGVTGRIEFRGHGDPVRGAVLLRIEGGRARFYRELSPTDPTP